LNFCGVAALWDMLQLVQTRTPGAARPGPRFHAFSAFDDALNEEIVRP